jgi:release factor glutamine methyltransferase
MSDEVWTVRRILEWTSGFFDRKQVDSPRLSSELLLAHVLNVPRIKLYTGYEQPLTPQALSQFRELVRRAAEHEPVAYVTGRAHIFNLELEIEPGVLIPRPDTETVVENVLQMVRHTVGMETPRVLDLCTGSGCIALAIAQRLPGAQMTAIDISPKAVDLARRNAEKLQLADRVRILQGDLYGPLAEPIDLAPFDIIVSNPPYIPSGDIPHLDRNVRDYEPIEALDGGSDGLAVHRRIIAAAPERLRPAGRLYLEVQFDQGPAVRDLIDSTEDLAEPAILKDHAGHERVVTARRD